LPVQFVALEFLRAGIAVGDQQFDFGVGGNLHLGGEKQVIADLDFDHWRSAPGRGDGQSGEQGGDGSANGHGVSGSRNRGKVRANRAPPRGDRSTAMVAWWSSAILRTMASPSPQPLSPESWRSPPTRWKRSKIRSRSPSGMPGPLSSTIRVAVSAPALTSTWMRAPRGLYLPALVSRLRIRVSRAKGSPATVGAGVRSPPPVSSTACPLSAKRLYPSAMACWAERYKSTATKPADS